MLQFFLKHIVMFKRLKPCDDPNFSSSKSKKVLDATDFYGKEGHQLGPLFQVSRDEHDGQTQKRLENNGTLNP